MNYQRIRINKGASICRRCRKEIKPKKTLLLDSKFGPDEKLYCLCKNCWGQTIEEIKEKMEGL